jgi:hypothetical protein
LTSLEQLNGTACTAGGTAGTIAVSYDSSRKAVFTCSGSTSEPPPPPPPPPPPSGTATLVVNEFSTGTTGAAADEFVEIANVGSAALDISGFKVVYRAAAGTSDVTLATIPASTTLAAGAYYLLGGSAYAGAKTPNQSFSAALAATGGGIAIKDASGAILDSVGYGSATNAFVEGTVAAAPPATDAPGSSAARTPNGRDTNDNASDFKVASPPTPGAGN